MHARKLARLFIYKKLDYSGFSSSIWVTDKKTFTESIAEYTLLEKPKIQMILDYLTFGCMGINYPDIAMQPLIDLQNGTYALSPFLWTNLDVERNFCVLANKIPHDKSIYSRLVNDKEELLKERLINEIKSMDLGLRCESGEIDGTDVDLAIIDDSKKVALTIELKWFIDPAEARELIDRSKELSKGIMQAKKIKKLFLNRNPTLLEKVLKIDSSYEFTSIVASFNWIGLYGIQDPDCTIAKVYHLIDIIKEKSCLKEAIKYFQNRKFLLVNEEDYKVIELDVKSDDWSCKWYGLKSLV